MPPKVARAGAQNAGRASASSKQEIGERARNPPHPAAAAPQALATGPCRAAEYLGDAPEPGFHVACFELSSGNKDGSGSDHDHDRTVRVTLYAEGWNNTLSAAAGRRRRPEQPVHFYLPLAASAEEMAAAFESSGLDLVSKNPGQEVAGSGGAAAAVVAPRRPWEMYSPAGAPLRGAGVAPLEAALAAGTGLLFSGGAFVQPGVRVGHVRRLEGVRGLPRPAGGGGGGEEEGSGRGGSSVAVLHTVSLHPLVFEVHGFLSEEECAYIRSEAAPHMAQSGVSLMDKDKGKAATEWRTSTTHFMPSRGHATLKAIDERVADLTRQPLHHQESVQVLRYGEGQKYDAHHDFFNPALYKGDPATMRTIDGGAKNRLATVLWYLSDVSGGGETNFPLVNATRGPPSLAKCTQGLKVKPQKGKVIMFYSLRADGSIDQKSLHGACPPVPGSVKWAANKWVWNGHVRHTEYRP